MQERLKVILEESKAQLEKATSLQEADETRVKVLGKKGALTEILKSMGYCVNVAEIARDHHNPLSKNPMAQIVRAADIYSAMREERSYKKAKSHEEAMEVLKSAKVPQHILDALDKKYGKKTMTNPIQGFSSHTEVA